MNGTDKMCRTQPRAQLEIDLPLRLSTPNQLRKPFLHLTALILKFCTYPIANLVSIDTLKILLLSVLSIIYSYRYR